MRLRMPWLQVLILGALLTPSVARAQEAERDWRFSVQASYFYGNVDGYVQTPSGGEPGTSSSKRPKLDEIGISDTSIYDVAGIAAYRNEEIYAGFQFIQMSGSTTLDQALISQGQTFPAGANVSSDVDMYWYRFGYRHRFTLGSEGEWTLWPSLGAAVWDFRYRLRGAAETADRSYVKVNAQLGLEGEWRPNRGRFAIDAAVLATPPISSLPEIYTEQLVAKYRVIDSDRVDLEGFGGIAFEQMYYEDNQTLSNHVKADFGPMLNVGLELRF
jgi:hypothetical protein